MTGDFWSLLLNPSHKPLCGGTSLQLRVSALVSVDLSQGLWQLCLVWEAGAEVRYEGKRGLVLIWENLDELGVPITLNEQC